MPERYRDEYEDEFSEEYSDSAYGHPVGLSVWALGLDPERPAGSKGPLKGVTQRPPSMAIGRTRAPGSRGPLPVEHDFLDVARHRLRPFKRKKTPLPMCWDRLYEFRDIVWFLVLAGYSPTFICEFFRKELPNLLPKLSKEGVTSSVRKIQKKARADQFLIDDELEDVLRYYQAGPWAHNAPDWLRSQYAVPLKNPESGSKDSQTRSGEVSRNDVAVEPDERRPGEQFYRELAFTNNWSKYVGVHPNTDALSPEEFVMGARGGVYAVLAHRESLKRAHDSENGAVPEQASMPASPVGGATGPKTINWEEERVKVLRFANESNIVEAATGKPLNLTAGEVGVALEYGLYVVLKRRLESDSS